MKNLLVYGSKEDLHLLKISKLLHFFGINVYFIDPLKLSNLSILISSDALGNIKLSANKYPNMELEEIYLSNCLVWKRNKRKELFITDEESRLRFYALKEVDDFIDGLIYSQSLIEISPNINRVKHDKKIQQLFLAKQVGLAIPDTIVANSKKEIRSFVASHDSCIIKPLKSSFWAPTRTDGKSPISILVNIITLKEIDDSAEGSFTYLPVIIQEEVKKAYEIRLVVVGDDYIAYKIDSQNSVFGKIDSRRANRTYKYIPTLVPEEVMERIYKYLKAAGLDYGVFDLAVAEDENYTFFECNSDGQWTFLEAGDESNPISTLFAQYIKCRIDNKR